MKTTYKFISLLCAVVASSLFVTSLAFADLKLPKASPSVSITQTMGLTDVTIEYSSPGVKGREIWGALVPFGKVWRTGANACTKISFSEDVSFAGEPVAKGKYCLFTVPGETQWSVVLNSNTEAWGSRDYDPKKNVASATAKVSKNPFTERLSISVKGIDNSGGSLAITWENVEVNVPLRVQTERHALRNIDALGPSASARDLSDAAQYLLENTDDLPRALKLAEQSGAKELNWRNQWVKAQILKAEGNIKGAVASAKKALELGDASGGFAFYKSQIEDATNWSVP